MDSFWERLRKFREAAASVYTEDETEMRSYSRKQWEKIIAQTQATIDEALSQPLLQPSIVPGPKGAAGPQGSAGAQGPGSQGPTTGPFGYWCASNHVPIAYNGAGGCPACAERNKVALLQQQNLDLLEKLNTIKTNFREAAREAARLVEEEKAKLNARENL